MWVRTLSLNTWHLPLSSFAILLLQLLCLVPIDRERVHAWTALIRGHSKQMATISISLHTITLFSARQFCGISVGYRSRLVNDLRSVITIADRDRAQTNFTSSSSRGRGIVLDSSPSSLRFVSLPKKDIRGVGGVDRRVVQPLRGRMGTGNQNGMQTATNGRDTKLEAKLYHMYVANKARDSNQGKYLDVENKYTGKVEARVPLASPDDLEEAVQAAVKAFPEMSTLPSFTRKAVLKKVVSELVRRSEEIAQIITMESGKAIKDARQEVDRSIDTFELAAEEVTRIYGDHMPLDISPRTKGLQGIVRKFPIGPVSMVSPWNFPLNLVAHKVAPALAVGCSFVLKPSSRTPLSALILGQILESCEELPKGAFSILPVSRQEADVFTCDERFKLLTFTGSGVAGWDMKARAGKKKVVMELGGNAPCIVEDLVPDLPGTIARLMIGGFYQAGQSCIHMQRLYVKDTLYEEVKNGLLDAVKKVKVGNPFDEDTFMGPMISESAAKGVEEWIHDAVDKGGKVLIGGTREGSFVYPTIMEKVPMEADARKEEIFGPVLLIYPYHDFKDAVEEANNTHYGLQAGIFTSDLNKAFYAFEKMEVGGVCLNDSPSMRVDSQPYGGLKDSGIQREGVKYAMDDMMESRVLVMRNVGTLY